MVEGCIRPGFGSAVRVAGAATVTNTDVGLEDRDAAGQLQLSIECSNSARLDGRAGNRMILQGQFVPAPGAVQEELRSYY